MISQQCPICGSSRIRRGYLPTPLWSKLLFRYQLLCDSCNWQFVGFALPGFISSKQTKSSRQKKEFSKNIKQNNSQPPLDEMQKESETSLSEEPKIKKRIRTRM